jgi:uncharacterized damage-inducible protein DinB
MEAVESRPVDAVQRHLARFRREREWTRALVACLPVEVFDWRPAPNAFSCGELVIHLMQAERFWRKLLVEAVAGRDYDPFRLAGATTAERYAAFRGPNEASARRAGLPIGFVECLAQWQGVQAETEAAFAAFTAQQLTTVVVHHPVAGLVAPLDEMLGYMLGHEAHHRGQLSAYAKMLGVPQPPMYVAT